MIWVAVVITIYLVVLLVNIFKKPTSTFIVENGEIYEEEFTEGYLIRDEQLVDIGDSSKGIVAIKSECEKVGKGEPIYRYCIENEDDINKKIQDIDMQILDNLSHDKEMFSAEVKIVNSQIDNKLDSLRECEEFQLISQCKSDVDTYLTKKIKIKAEQSDNKTLQNLVKKREECENELEKKSSYINAEKSGVISYRIDGLENELNINDLSKITEKYLKNLDIETSEIIATATDSGKIVDNFKCNIACILESEEAKRSTKGMNVKIRLPDAQEIPAKIIESAQQESGKQLVIFEISNNIADLIKYRKISLDVIWWSDSGLKVANSAIKSEGNFSYVTRNRAGLKEKIPIKVLRSNGKYSIVENYTYAELREAGYNIETLSSRKTISVHDQVEN